VLLVDTKRVEMLHYAGIPHLLAPVIHDAGAATRALEDLVLEMERRYTEMSDARVRNLEHLNAARVADGRPALPRIVCFIDEFADLMLHAAEEVELAVVELAQKARAIGIHLVVATQSPRADVITGIIKANVPARASFAVASGLESRIILDCNGAEQLGGQGDMLLRLTGCDPRRLQGALVTEAEIAEVVARAMTQEAPVDEQPDDDSAPGEHDAAAAGALDDAAPADVPDSDAPAEDPAVIPQPAACCDVDDDEDRCAACASTAAPTAVAVRPPAVGHEVVVARVLDAATGLGELLTRADAQAVSDGAVEILRGHYLAALLSAIQGGNVDPALLDRFERLCGFDTPT
jgi:DNA segregation ATPase FtsK/SpoIIIE-like protein